MNVNDCEGDRRREETIKVEEDNRQGECVINDSIESSAMDTPREENKRKR